MKSDHLPLELCQEVLFVGNKITNLGTLQLFIYEKRIHNVRPLQNKNGPIKVTQHLLQRVAGYGRFSMKNNAIYNKTGLHGMSTLSTKAGMTAINTFKTQVAKSHFDKVHHRF